MMIASFRAQYGRALADNRGGALVMAISMMGLFALLGTLYVRHMNIEADAAHYALWQARAEQLAAGGIEAAMGDLTAARRENRLNEVLGQRRYGFPAFKAERGEAGLELQEETRSRSRVEVLVEDESGKINLNHAPASVLQRILDIDGATAREIASSRPRGNSREGDWLWRKEDLLLRGLLSEEQYRAASLAHVTTYTVSDHTRPLGYFNINAASPEALSAILDLPLDAAESVHAQPDFTSLDALAQAAGKDPNTFNIKPDPFRPDQFPPAFSTQSHCFRLQSVATYTPTLGPGLKEAAPVVAAIEAVVLFGDSGPEILAWSALREEPEN